MGRNLVVITFGKLIPNVFVIKFLLVLQKKLKGIFSESDNDWKNMEALLCLTKRCYVSLYNNYHT